MLEASPKVEIWPFHLGKKYPMERNHALQKWMLAQVYEAKSKDVSCSRSFGPDSERKMKPF